MRSFDPDLLGRLETDAWVAYYRRRWLPALRAFLSLTREAFGLPLPSTLRGGWLVLRANQVWAPYPDNDPDAARRYMARFFSIVASHHGEGFDPEEAARREVEWWRVHRELQHDRDAGDDSELVAALSRDYAYLYSVSEEEVASASRHRATAMLHSDRWVAEGCDPTSSLIESERAELVESYRELLAAVGRG